MVFGYGQFARLGKQKTSNNDYFLGTGTSPGVIDSITIVGTGAGTTSKEPGSGYRYETFTASGTLIVSQPVVVDMIVVGGGGAGGQFDPTGSQPPTSTWAGGGGAGGMVHIKNTTLTVGTYTVIIGAGAGTASSIRGTPTRFSNPNVGVITANGGGVGGFWSNLAQSGGSGGGAVDAPIIPLPAYPGGSATQPTTIQSWNAGGTIISYGNPGSSGASSRGGGGGGAGAAGGPVSPGLGGNGGAGINTGPSDYAGVLIGVPALTPESGYYAGGGGGGGSPSSSLGSGGLGGGGGGPNIPPTGDLSGQQNTGGGGGAQLPPVYAGPPGVSPYNGGSGIVVIRYFVGP